MTEETITTTGTEGAGAETGTDTALDLGNQAKQDDVFEKHLDIAIEAQDGKAEVKGGEADAGAAKDTNKQAAVGQDKPSGGNDNKGQQQADKPGDENKGGARGPKDLVLKGQGEGGVDLVIKGGPERRWYEQMQTARQRAGVAEERLGAMQTQLQSAQTQLTTLQETVRATQGMPAEQLALATRLFNDLTRDPVTTITKLLAEAKAKGLTVEGIGSSVDARAIEAIIDARLGASLNSQRGQSDEEIQLEAQHEANTFFSRFPDARLHEPLIVQVMRDHPSVDLHTAYFSLKDNFATRGFDWNRPLDQQLAERSAEADQQTSAELQQQQNGTAQPGLPGSRPATPASTEAGKPGVVAHESTSIDDIIRESMRENGLNPN